MRRSGLGIGPLLFSSFFACLPVAHAQEAPSSPRQKQNAPPANKKSQKKAKAELSDDLSRVINEDLIYIITPEERAAFARLGTNEEREQFIEQIFNRRNPNPESGENTFKEEHYRRIAYANEHFSSGIPGWKTDRGHIYIVWGPPDELESHPTGGTYDRPMWQGGGSTTTYPWELWRYRHLEGIGDNIELEFVDPTSTGEFRLTMDPGEKDALQHVPGAGPSLLEGMGIRSRSERFSNSNGTTLPAPLGGVPASMNEFERLNTFYKAMQPPQPLKDMTALVSSRIANPIHLDFAVSFLRVTSDATLVPITVQIPNREMGFRSKQGVQSATLSLYARITSPSGQLVQSFDETIARDVPESLFQKSLEQSSIYQKSVPLRPGLYRLDVVVKDSETGNVGVIGTALRVPRYETESLDASSLILADQIESVPSREVNQGQFVFGSYKVRPRLSGDFSRSENLGLFLQLYNLKPDEAVSKSRIFVTYRILRAQQEIWKVTENSDNLHQNGEQVTLNRQIPLAAFSPARYTLEITVEDKVAAKSISRSAEFTIKP